MLSDQVVTISFLLSMYIGTYTELVQNSYFVQVNHKYTVSYFTVVSPSLILSLC